MSCVRNAGARSVLCDVRNMRVDRTLMTVAAGGEPIASVFGRAEEAEFPVYRKGAFRVAGCAWAPSGELPHYLSSVVQTGFEAVNGALDCAHWEELPTLFITRYEYANLYHTTTDWYNTWATLGWAGLLEAREDSQQPGRTQVLRPRPHSVVWLDGHAQGSLDDVWTTVFTPNVRFISQVLPGTCYRRALFVPAGYSAPIYDWPDTCGAQTAVREFGEFVLAQYGLNTVPLRRNQATFTFREPYIAHPRNPSGYASRRIANRPAIEAVLATRSSISLNPINTTFIDQLRVIHSSRMLLGVHGAGLTHVLFMHPGTRLVEFQPPTHPLEHFSKLARWAGVEYTNHPPFGLQGVGNEEYTLDTAALDRYLAESLKD